MTEPIVAHRRPRRWRVLALLAAAFALSAPVVAQEVGPVGPGPIAFDGVTLSGHFAAWDRTATPRLVLQAPGNRVLRPFADIASDGAFTIVLPEIGPDTPLGSTVCGAPGKARITVLFDLDLLTTLEGFTTPSEANGGLSVIGMAVAADAEFATDIGAPGTRWVQWFASLAPRTVEVDAGWTAVTVVSGPSGGPHVYRPGIEEGIGWYWWAFSESAAESPPPAPREQPAWMVGSWQGVQGDTTVVVTLGADGVGSLEATEGGRSDRFEGPWSIGGGRFQLDTDQGPFLLLFEADGEVGFTLYPERDGPGIPFVRGE
jgi:hypothetical protein